MIIYIKIVRKVEAINKFEMQYYQGMANVIDLLLRLGEYIIKDGW